MPHIEPITSSQNPRFKNALRLHSSRGRQKQNRIVVIGNREVRRAIRAGLEFTEIYGRSDPTTPETLKELVSQLAETPVLKNTKVFALDAGLFEKLAYGDRTPDLIGIADRPATELANIPLADQSLLIVLESLEKPGNLGAIARSADGSGADGLLIAEPLTDIFHPNAIRSSVSTVFSVPVACGSSEEIRQWLITNGYAMMIATPEAARSIYETNLTGRNAIVFGNEAKGLSDNWRSNETTGIRLPMLGTADSLNVSVTASLFMYERRRQLGLLDS